MARREPSGPQPASDTDPMGRRGSSTALLVCQAATISKREDTFEKDFRYKNSEKNSGAGRFRSTRSSALASWGVPLTRLRGK